MVCNIARVICNVADDACNVDFGNFSFDFV